MQRLCVCLLNISEARDFSLVQRVAKAALRVNKQNGSDQMKAAVLNIFNDFDYNRSVITIAADSEHIGASVTAACLEAYSLIDLEKHIGGHPRLGSVDLVPIHPISPDISLDECGHIARSIAESVTTQLPGTSAFLFGHADLPLKRGLVARRKAVHWFDGCHGSSYDGIAADVGAPPASRYGLTGIGAIPYVMNCNVTISTQDVDFGRQIAASLRARNPGGLTGVQAMAFAHEGTVEVACNVEAIDTSEVKVTEDQMADLVCSFGKFYNVAPEVIQQRVARMAATRGIQTVPEATIIGFTPEQARNVAIKALGKGIEDFWKTRTSRFM